MAEEQDILEQILSPCCKSNMSDNPMPEVLPSGADTSTELYVQTTSGKIDEPKPDEGVESALKYRRMGKIGNLQQSPNSSCFSRYVVAGGNQAQSAGFQATAINQSNQRWSDLVGNTKHKNVQ